MAVYPSNKAWIGAKLWQNAFRAICIFSFFDADFFFLLITFLQKFAGLICFFKVRFWRSYEILIRVGRCVVKSYCPKWPYFCGDFLVEGVKDSICVLDLDLAPKMTSTMWCCDLTIIWWYDDMIQWYFLGSFFFFSKKWRFGGAMFVWSALEDASWKVIARTAFILGETSLEKG